MNTQSRKSTQIFQGILTGIGLWIFGHLLSGRLSLSAAYFLPMIAGVLVSLKIYKYNF